MFSTRSSLFNGIALSFFLVTGCGGQTGESPSEAAATETSEISSTTGLDVSRTNEGPGCYAAPSPCAVVEAGADGVAVYSVTRIQLHEEVDGHPAVEVTLALVEAVQREVGRTERIWLRATVDDTGVLTNPNVAVGERVGVLLARKSADGRRWGSPDHLIRLSPSMSLMDDRLKVKSSLRAHWETAEAQAKSGCGGVAKPRDEGEWRARLQAQLRSRDVQIVEEVDHVGQTDYVDPIPD